MKQKSVLKGSLQRLRRAVGLVFWEIRELFARLFGKRKPYEVLKLEIAGELQEQPDQRDILSRKRNSDFGDLLSILTWAREDSQLKIVVVDLDQIDAGWARIQEIRKAFSALREAGKELWFSLVQVELKEYYLASVADRLFLTPAGSLDVTGISSEVTFLSGALAKLGVKAEVLQMGAFKSAGEMFTRNEMSPEHREMVESLVDDLYQQTIEGISEGRKIDVPQVLRVIDQGPFLGEEALAHHLIDDLRYRDEVESDLEERFGSESLIEMENYQWRKERETKKRVLQKPVESIGVLRISGTIKTGESGTALELMSGSGSDSVSEDLATLRERDDISAVVLRIDSPGGSGLASDLIWREVVRTAEKKPVLASFGDVAASGGYYIGVAANPIFAEKGTLTGSIGVLAGKAVLRELYDKLGITKEQVTRGKHAALNSDYIPLDSSTKERLGTHAQHFYDLFIDRVAQGRSLSPEKVEEIAQGRVWTGHQGLQNGLVDREGGLEAAIAEAKATIGVSPNDLVAVEEYPQPQAWWRVALKGFSSRTQLFSPIGKQSKLIRRQNIWAIMPFQIRVY